MQEKKKDSKIIDNIDKERIDYASNLIQDLGYSKQEAIIKASSLHKHFHRVSRSYQI